MNMKPSEYQDWMKQAFLSVEAKVGTELIQSTGKSITEEHIRDAMVKGMKVACPSRATDVDIEWAPQWAEHECWFGGGTKAGGRSIQHDIVVKSANKVPDLICEVKWLKTTATSEVIQDIWKLLLSRATVNEQSAVRVYLLIGGEGDAFRSTLDNVRRHGAYLKWSRTKGKLPEPHVFGLKKVMASSVGYGAFEQLIGWGAKDKRQYRTPPSVLKQYSISTRATWFRKLGLALRGNAGIEATWHAALWEITSRSASKKRFSYATVKAKFDALRFKKPV